LFITPGDMIHLQDSANTLYMTGTAFLFIIYSDVLLRTGEPGREAEAAAGVGAQQTDYVLEVALIV
jgi:endoglucanase